MTPHQDGLPELQLWCGTCEGGGTVDNTLGGGNINATAHDPCPDCDGKGYIVSHRYRLADAALQLPAQGAVPGHKLLEDGKTMVPESWTPLRLEWEPGYPEDVAFGPRRMMDRLKKWLDRHFATISAVKARDWMSELGFEVRRNDDVWLLVDDCGNEREATLNERVLWGALLNAQPASPERKPLTDEQMWALWNSQGSDEMNQTEAVAFARAIEAALGIAATQEPRT